MDTVIEVIALYGQYRAGTWLDRENGRGLPARLRDDRDQHRHYRIAPQATSQHRRQQCLLKGHVALVRPRESLQALACGISRFQDFKISGPC